MTAPTDTAAAVAATAQALAAARAAAAAAPLAEALLAHANALVLGGRLVEARAAVAEAVALHRAQGSAADEARCLVLEAALWRLAGDSASAAQCVRAAIALAQHDPLQLGAAQAELGEIELARGDARAADAAFAAAIGAVAPVPAAWLQGRGRALAAAGDFEQAAAQLLVAEQRSDAAGDAVLALDCGVAAATAWQQARRFDRAAAIVRRLRPRAQALGRHAALAALELLATTDAIERGDLAAARAAASAARGHALASNAATAYIGAMVALARLDERGGDRGAAYGRLATGWATLGDLLGADLARATFAPLLQDQRQRWGDAAFDAARHAYEAARRARRSGVA